jgi:hypothetical protein
MIGLYPETSEKDVFRHQDRLGRAISLNAAIGAVSCLPPQRREVARGRRLVPRFDDGQSESR